MSKRVEEFISDDITFNFGSSSESDRQKHSIIKLIYGAEKYMCEGDMLSKARQKAEKAYRLYSGLNYDKNNRCKDKQAVQ